MTENPRRLSVVRPPNVALNDADAEASVLGVALGKPDHARRVLAELPEAAFTHPGNRRVYRAVAVALARYGDAAPLLVAGVLRDEGSDEGFFGQRAELYVADLYSRGHGGLAVLAHLVARLRDKHAQRQVARTLERERLEVEAGVVDPDRIDRMFRTIAEHLAPPRAPEHVAPPDTLAGALERVATLLRRYIYFPQPTSGDVLALWVAHTHVVTSSHLTPYIAVSSPTKGAGKTRLLELLAELVARPMHTIEPSPATLYRAVHETRATVLLDETDAVFSRVRRQHSEELRGLLNSGYKRSGVVPRYEQRSDGSWELTMFSTFSAKLLAGIDLYGCLPDTIADRCIFTGLEVRRPTDPPIAEWDRRAIEAETTAVGEWLKGWGLAAAEPLRDARPAIPAELTNRRAELAEPLLAIAELANNGWAEYARGFLVEHLEDAGRVEEDPGVTLLRDMRDVFDSRGDGRIETAELLEALVEIETSPWAGYWGKAVATRSYKTAGRSLARMLRRFDVAPRRLPGGGNRGYYREDFVTLWSRYVPETGEGGGAVLVDATNATNVTSAGQSGGIKPDFDATNPPLDATSEREEWWPDIGVALEVARRAGYPTVPGTERAGEAAWRHALYWSPPGAAGGHRRAAMVAHLLPSPRPQAQPPERPASPAPTSQGPRTRPEDRIRAPRGARADGGKPGGAGRSGGRYPTHVWDGSSSLAATLETLAAGRGGPEPTLWVHEADHARLGLPERVPEAVVPLLELPDGWTARTIGAAGWTIAQGPGLEPVHVAFARWSEDFAGTADAGELADALELYARAVGLAYLFSSPATLHTLIRRSSRLTPPHPQPDLEPAYTQTAYSVPAHAWTRALDLEEQTRPLVRAFDRSGSYLAAWAGCTLGDGPWRAGGADTIGPGPESSRPAGYWLVDIREISRNVSADLPNPFVRYGDGARAWLTTPLLQLALELAGEPIPVAASWTQAERSRPLDAVAAQLGRARAALTRNPAPAARVALDAIKTGYAGAVAWLEFGKRPPDPLARPEWRRTILDRYTANTWRSLARADARPFALTDVDTVLYAVRDVDEIPAGLRVGVDLGAWKPKGRAIALNPDADPRALLEELERAVR